MNLVLELTKEEILRYLTLFEPLRDAPGFYEFIRKCNTFNKEINIIANDLPTYEEHLAEELALRIANEEAKKRFHQDLEDSLRGEKRGEVNENE